MKHISVVVLVCMVFATVCLAAEEWKNITVEDGLPSNRIISIQEDKKGNLWFTTSKGLVQYKDGEMEVRLEGDEIWDLIQVDTDQYWVGTNDGIVVMNNGETNIMFEGHKTVPILHYGDGKYWALGKKGNSQKNVVAEMTEDGWDAVSFFEDKAIVDLFRGSDGRIWAVEDGNGLYEIEPGEEFEDVPHHLEGFNVTSITEDSDGNIWCGLWDRGIRVYKRGEWESHLEDSETYVFEIAEDSQGHIWVATSSSGVWQFDGNGWENHLEDDQVNMLEATGDDRVWINTQGQGGLRYWNGDEWQFAVDNGLPFRCVYQSEDGKIWAGSILSGVFVGE